MTNTESLVRVGSWLWQLPLDDPRSNAELLAGLAKNLEADPRVVSFQVPEPDEHYDTRITVFPDESRSTAEEVRSGDDAFDVLQLVTPIGLEVRVPIKNQPLHGGADDVPSDTYQVAWDGVTAIVLWHQSDQVVPLSGGQIVSDVIRDALQRQGTDLYVQNCSPGCTFGFLHMTMVTRVDPNVTEIVMTPLQSHLTGGLLLTLPEEREDDHLVWELSLRWGRSLRDFALVKNLGRRLVDLEIAGREDLGQVLRLSSDHAGVAARGYSYGVWRDRWAQRAWRRESRSLVAAVWLTVTNIEALSRTWQDAYRRLQREEQLLPLVRRDLSDDAEKVLQQDVGAMVGVLSQVAASLDNRLVVQATVGGALAGGVVAAAATLL